MDTALKHCIDFLNKGVSPFHAVKEAARRLEEAGFTELSEGSPWDLAPGGCYYTTRNGSSVIAWRMPEKNITGWSGTLSHSDSPTFRISAGKTADPRYGRARVEEYGGPRFSTWMDRPLIAAGRLFLETEKGMEVKLVETKPLLCMPNLCCHFDRDGRKGAPLNMLQDMQPIFGEAGRDLLSVFRKEGEILDYDLVLALAEKATVFGLKGEYFTSARIDDLASAASTLEGFLAFCRMANETVLPSGRCRIWCMFDNEEVGSSTRQGAAGSFLPDVMARIEEAYNLTREMAVRARTSSLFLSADNGHAVPPNHPELVDSEHPIYLNKGVVVKLTANQKYTSTAQTVALFRTICDRAGVPTQVFYNRPDVIGGGTLGNILSTHVSVPMVDIGLPQLAMHSAMETAGTKDPGYMAEACRAFYETDLCQEKDGVWTIR